MQLANLHNDGKQTSVSEAVFQRALKMTYESLVTSDPKVLCRIFVLSQVEISDVLLFYDGAQSLSLFVLDRCTSHLPEKSSVTSEC